MFENTFAAERPRGTIRYCQAGVTFPGGGAFTVWSLIYLLSLSDGASRYGLPG